MHTCSCSDTNLKGGGYSFWLRAHTCGEIIRKREKWGKKEKREKNEEKKEEKREGKTSFKQQEDSCKQQPASNNL